MLRTIRLAVLFILLGAIASASNLRQISSREGISNNAILSLAQDKHGFIWVGSCDGLNMWDGERMQLFPNDWSGQTSLSGNLIEEIAVSTDSLFWIRTNYGLDLFDPDSKRVESHSCFQGMYRIVTRHSDQVLVVTQDNKFSYYDRLKRQFSPAKPVEEAEYADLLDMLLDAGGNLWTFSRKGIFFRAAEFPSDGSEVQFGTPRQIQLTSPPEYAFAADDRAYFIDRKHTLYEFDIKSRQVIYQKDMAGELARMGAVSSIIRDGDDYIVSFYTNGVIRLRMTPEHSVKYVTEHINIACGVFSLLRDTKQDIVWIGTDGQGLYQHTRNATAFRSISFNELPYNLSKPVRALHIDREKTLWVGTKGEGVLRITNFYACREFDTGNVQQLTAANSALLDNSVYTFAQSGRNLLWIGTDGDGLNYYSYGDRRIHSLRTPVPLKYVHALYETSPDTLWVATVGCGVFRITLGGSSTHPVVREVEQLHFNDELEIKNFFFSLYPESDSVMWFGNRGGGAVRYDIGSGESEVYKFDHSLSTIANDIFAIYRSTDGVLWFGTSGGLLRFSQKMTTQIPGITGTVHGILEDRKGELWLSTNRGLVQYSPRTGFVVTYGYSYGLNTIEYSDGAYFADPQTGILFFGGINGLVTIEDTGFKERDYNPPVLFRDIRLGDGIHNISNMLSPDGVLNLQSGQRIFEITVSALDYVNGSNYTYYSRLDGYNEQWVSTSQKMSFTNIPAGSYRLDVRYRNNITGTKSPVYSMPIYIKPVWYATILAKCLYILLALVIIGGTIRYYLLRYRRRRAEKLQRLEARRKEEVYESKMRFFANITQELSMPLTMISAPSQQILGYRRSDPYILKHAQTIRQNVSKLHDLIYMLHEFRDIRTGQHDENENIELVPVAEIAQSIIETYGEYSQQNSIHCELDIEHNLVWPTDREGLSTILNTLMSNAFKHTPYNGTVSLIIRNAQGKLLISTSNDSAGVNLEDIEAIFDRYRVLDYFERKSERGLSFRGDLRLAICHSIVVRMQGEITVESTPNAQTTFTVRLPRLKVTQDNTAANENIVPIDKELGLPLQTVTRPEFTFDKNRRTMFIVNDNSEIMNFVAELFASDYNIKMPASLNEMIELLKQMHPDIVICDALSEQSDCLSLIKFIKEGKLTSHIPVILLSTAQQVDERIKGVESGADICLTLPFNVEYLKAVAEQLLRRNRSLKDYYKSSISAFELSDGRMLHQDDKEFIDKMLKIINDNISNTEISTKFIADELGVSIRNLYRRLEGILNQTPTNIIKEYRLAKAEQLLTTTKLSIDEIIYKAGFVNRGTFFKCFAAKYGCTPKVYRKEKLSQMHQQVDAQPYEQDDEQQ
ncbi:two-component regulator propeller domain-containing protein [uncultured Alistipes sp.]|jgi:two-component system sensor histidine kinase/response regulator, hybrid (one-component system)|uniref:two-component regulator propeller domain-containing protein n=1 Tax=uncultured Alistipes sp. TaxID=538949 RepID=UPI0025DBA639|nr:two-component regulator propeller domain-containing protein [uncultured Alistipes sp.]